MKQFDTSTLVPGSKRIIKGENEADIVMRTVDYLKSILGPDAVRETTVSEIKSRITDVSHAA